MAEIICPHCRATYSIDKTTPLKRLVYCIYCGKKLTPDAGNTTIADLTSPGNGTLSTASSATIIPGHEPKEAIQFTLGSYRVVKTIGQGGMGEVFLAYDTTCGRKIALKRIRSDLVEHIQMHNRFMKEARITSQLTHPSIIPIYTIHGQDQQVYYTMPFVEGETLKQILRATRAQEKKGEKLHHIGGSIPALVRIFLSICQAIAYAHSKNVLHRDIKPENIIIGQYGEVLILDWGLAKMLHPESKDQELGDDSFDEERDNPYSGLTNIGKVVGTVSYMAPERAIGSPANIQTDIYSLGVILYQILTLQHPFKRGTLKEFRENLHLEVLHDPAVVAPYRDVPRVLARIAMKCLSPQLDQRYNSVSELIHDLENYIEGRAEWFQIAALDPHNKSDWEFQEHVLIAEHVAITRGTEISDWVWLMVSKQSFQQNVRIEAKVKLGTTSHGLGFLMCVPETQLRTHINDGYSLWLGTEENRSTKLLRSTVEVVQTPDVFLNRDEWINLRIEKIENNIYVYINGQLQFSYISHMPITGTHIGLLARDDDYEIKDFHVFVASQSVMVNCLAVPDAFLAQKQYEIALSEYRRIGYSFPGRAEGREAMFRAGITLLEQANNCKDPQQAEILYDQSQDEFEKLHSTPGAPFEYLGKALVYQALHEYDEEIKCFELACRRYPRHPLLPIIHEQIVYRMHMTAKVNRSAAYKFVLLVARHMPRVAASSYSQKLFSSLKKHWEPLPFIEEDKGEKEAGKINHLAMGITLAFWLAKPYVLEEIIDEILQMKQPPLIDLYNALYCLIELGCWKLAKAKLDLVRKRSDIWSSDPKAVELIAVALIANEQSVDVAMKKYLSEFSSSLDFQSERILFYLIDRALLARSTKSIKNLKLFISDNSKPRLVAAKVCAYMLEKDWVKAGELLQEYPVEYLTQESSPLHFLYGCWLYATEGKDIASIHFSGVLEVAYPRSWTLFSHFYDLRFPVSEHWLPKAFLYEKRQFYKQLFFFYSFIGDNEKAQHYERLEREQYIQE